MTCEDQALVSTEVCVKFGCENSILEMEIETGFWKCPKCSVSYGEYSKYGLIHKFEYLNSYGTLVTIITENSKACDFSLKAVLIDGEKMDDIYNIDNLIGNIVGNLVEELINLKAHNSTLLKNLKDSTDMINNLEFLEAKNVISNLEFEILDK